MFFVVFQCFPLHVSVLNLFQCWIVRPFTTHLHGFFKRWILVDGRWAAMCKTPCSKRGFRFHSTGARCWGKWNGDEPANLENMGQSETAKRIMIIWVKTMKKTNYHYYHFWMIHVWSYMLICNSYMQIQFFSKSTSAWESVFYVPQKYGDLVKSSRQIQVGYPNWRANKLPIPRRACISRKAIEVLNRAIWCWKGKIPGESRKIPVMETSAPHGPHSSPSLKDYEIVCLGSFPNLIMTKFLDWNF